MVGALFIGKIIDKHPRTYLLKICDLISIGAMLFEMIDYYSFLIIIGRFVLGIAAGFNSTLVAIYINEISPSEISGQMVKKILKH